MSKITLNIIEHGNPAPVDPSGGSVNTGLFTYGIGAPEAAIIISTILVLTIVGMVLATYIFRKCKKASKTSKLINIAEQTKATRKSKKTHHYKLSCHFPPNINCSIHSSN